MTNNALILNGKDISVAHSEGENRSWLDDIYRSHKMQYLKFFKMDNLCKAGFLAAELIGNDIGWDKTVVKNDVAVVCFNRSSSLDDDMNYQQTIRDSGNYFPSPSIFVYTLANIVTGEIAIRNKIAGETSFYIMENFSSKRILEAIEDIFANPSIKGLLCGWTEYFDQNCDILMMYLERNKGLKTNITENIIKKIYN
ncbi:MAG: hypothetical protein LBH92_06150 [Bacteroidales bacterium]|jgi:3-oxoacyl-[acyl-carrier-protein] synthase-1|nr:hypothetical protein [Bacteroidales bacterium]